jgi:hypothetical protein
VNRALLVALCFLLSALSHAQAQLAGGHRFDLSQIGAILEGEQICEDVGRMQDWPSKVMDQIIAEGPKSIPILIAMISDTRMAKTREPIICYWGAMSIGDIAFCLLSDLFTETGGSAIGGRATIPGAGWDEMLGPRGDLPAWEQLHRYIKKQGRAALQAKWQAVWKKYGDRIVWDPKERCFRLRSSQ